VAQLYRCDECREEVDNPYQLSMMFTLRRPLDSDDFKRTHKGMDLCKRCFELVLKRYAINAGDFRKPPY
jgi:hypothetical protein